MEGTVPSVTVDAKTELGASLVGVLVAAGAAYHAGATGEWVSLLGVSMALSLLVVFVSSE